MSTIRLQGTTSGYYDLTVPAAAGTNSIDLSTLVTTNSGGNLTLDGNLTVQGQFEVHKDYNANYYKKDDGTTLGYILFRDNGPCYYEYNSTNAGQDFRFASNNQTKWALDATGRMTVSNQPAFYGYGNTGWQVFSNSTYTRLLFANTTFDIGGHLNTTNGIYTCPVDGIYHFNFGVYARLQGSHGNNTNYWGAYMRKNSAILNSTSIVGYYEDGTNDNTTTQSFYVQCAANDTIDVVARAAGPSNGEYYGTHCYFSGALAS